MNKRPIAEASENVILTARTGKENGIIASETENKQGFVMLDGRYTDLITGRTLTGKVEINPYEVLVLKK